MDLYSDEPERWWFRNGQLHRSQSVKITDSLSDYDLPAKMLNLEYDGFAHYWYRHGKLHRANNSPAVVMHGNGNKYYEEHWIDGVLQRKLPSTEPWMMSDEAYLLEHGKKRENEYNWGVHKDLEDML
jgi:hypothetical protein